MRNKVTLCLNNIKIRNKLIITYLIVAIATVSIVCIYLTNRMNSIIVNKAITEAEKNVGIIEYRMKEVFKVATRVSDMIYTDYNLQGILTSKYESTLDVYNAYNDYDILGTYLKYYNELWDITIFIENDTLLPSKNISRVNDEIRQSKWYQDALEGDGKIRWYYGNNMLSDNNCVSLVRLLKNNRGQQVGVLAINISNIALRSINNDDSSNHMSLNGDIMLLNKKINISQNISQNNLRKIIKKSDDGKQYVIDAIFEGKECYMVINSFKADKSLSDEFQSIVILPLDSIVGQTNKAIYSSFYIAILAIIFSLIIILYFSKNISHRINLLSSEMRRVVNGDLYVSDKIYGNDEIGQLHIDLKKMVESIRNLIDRVYKQEVNEEKLKASQREAEFKMLSNQINPHFLYNTLETIRMKALLKGDKETSDIVKKLGKIMRRNLEVSGKPVTLDSEVELIRNYLEIQSMRFEGMVKFEIIIDDEINAKEYMILPLLLQPVVENAFVHGLEEKKEKGTILINIYKCNNTINICVEDNGVGIDEEKLIMLNKALHTKQDTSKSIGMRNVNQRIKIYYGKEYGVYIESVLKVGTRVIITLPL